jgi:hypothetical protein
MGSFCFYYCVWPLFLKQQHGSTVGCYPVCISGIYIFPIFTALEALSAGVTISEIALRRRIREKPRQRNRQEQRPNRNRENYNSLTLHMLIIALKVI